MRSDSAKKALSSILSIVMCVGVFTTVAVRANAAENKTFSVMTYNVYTQKAGVNEYFMPEHEKASYRSKLSAAMVSTIHPDIFATSEETKIFTQTFKEKLKNYESVGEDIFYSGVFNQMFSNPSVVDANRIYYDREKFGFLATDMVYLHEGNVHEIGLIPDETNYRAATFLALRYRPTGEKVVIANTHLGLKDDIIRRQSEIFVREAELFAKKHGIYNIIYLGDFNLSPENLPAMSKLNNIWDSNVQSNNTGNLHKGIDHIFTTKNMVIEDRTVINKEYWYDCELASDHRPVMANVHFGSYTKLDRPDNRLKTTIAGNTMQITSNTMPDIGMSDRVFVEFYNGDAIVMTTQLAPKAQDGAYYLNEAVNIPKNATSAKILIFGSTELKTLNLWN